jgi:hypothetical protein
MASAHVSTKRLAIDKANTRMVIAVAIASFVTVFALVAAHSLWTKGLYQHKVLGLQHKANDQLKRNITSADQLNAAYKAFIGAPQNAIGGNPSGSGQNDGDNAKLVLDALPSKYDFPALTASIEKILSDRNFSIDSIGGTDDELAQQGNKSSNNPQPVEMPFTFSVSKANYQSVQDLIKTMQHSIRPLAIDTLNITGGGSSMQLTVTAHTYYQPGKSLGITQKAVQQ